MLNNVLLNKIYQSKNVEEGTVNIFIFSLKMSGQVEIDELMFIIMARVQRNRVWNINLQELYKAIFKSYCSPSPIF